MKPGIYTILIGLVVFLLFYIIGGNWVAAIYAAFFCGFWGGALITRLFIIDALARRDPKYDLFVWEFSEEIERRKEKLRKEMKL